MSIAKYSCGNVIIFNSWKQLMVCYTSQLKYVLKLEENRSHVMGENSLTPKGQQTDLLPTVRKRQLELSSP